MPTPTFLRDLASDVLNGRVSVTSAALAISLVEQAEALEGGLAKGEPVVEKERLFWFKASDDESLFLGVEGCDVLSSHYTALATAAHSFKIEGKGKARRVEVDSLEAAAELVYGWALEDGYDVAPCPADLLLPKKVALVWVEHNGWHLCLPGGLNYMQAPYSYWASPIDWARGYDDLGAKFRQRVNGCAEEAGIKLIVEWATADGYEVPPFPGKAAPVVEPPAEIVTKGQLVWGRSPACGFPYLTPAGEDFFVARFVGSSFVVDYCADGWQATDKAAVGSEQEALQKMIEWATSLGYEVPPCPYLVVPAPSLVWHKEADPYYGVVGIHLCYPNKVIGSDAPYSYFDADEYESAVSEAYTDLGAKTYNYKEVCGRLAGLALLMEWAEADGFVVPKIPAEFLVEPIKVGKEEIARLVEAYTLLKELRELNPDACYSIRVYGDGSGVLLSRGDEWVGNWSFELNDITRVVRQEIDRVKAAKP